MPAAGGTLLALALTLLFAGGAQAAPPKIRGKACLDCHADVQKQAARTVVHAPFEDAKGCEACHKRHGVVGVLALKAEEPELCLGCHEEQAAELKQAHLHSALKPGNDGKPGKCTSCHAAHASDQPKLVKAAGNESCFACHAREKFTQGSVHAPAAASCLGCHGPHGTAQRGLLRQAQADLCASCHRAGGSARPAEHSGFAVTGRDCTGCHAPHTSKEKGLLRAVVHSPLSDCSSCHVKPAETGGKLALTKAQPELCQDCHGDTAEEAKKPVVHAAFTSGECSSCHDPHAGDGKGLLASAQKDLCVSCHDSVGKELSTAHVHAPAAEGECASCHVPHAGTEKKLLKAKTADLCA
ncbi:MAG TPA: cytochrome c3 family protein, partial [Vicinamibacteria bacterium]|nr:cytochrome c3 family protein [Vicinamibacteria bacterium]